MYKQPKAIESRQPFVPPQ